MERSERTSKGALGTRLSTSLPSAATRFATISALLAASALYCVEQSFADDLNQSRQINSRSSSGWSPEPFAASGNIPAPRQHTEAKRVDISSRTSKVDTQSDSADSSGVPQNTLRNGSQTFSNLRADESIADDAKFVARWKSNKSKPAEANFNPSPIALQQSKTTQPREVSKCQSTSEPSSEVGYPYVRKDIASLRRKNSELSKVSEPAAVQRRSIAIAKPIEKSVSRVVQANAWQSRGEDVRHAAFEESARDSSQPLDTSLFDMPLSSAENELQSLAAPLHMAPRSNHEVSIDDQIERFPLFEDDTKPEKLDLNRKSDRKSQDVPPSLRNQSQDLGGRSSKLPNPRTQAVQDEQSSPTAPDSRSPSDDDIPGIDRLRNREEDEDDDTLSRAERDARDLKSLPDSAKVKRQSQDCDEVRSRAKFSDINIIQLDTAPKFGVGPKDKVSNEERQRRFAQKAPSRSWTDFEGVHLADGRMVNLENDTVIIESFNGELLALAVRELSQADLTYVTDAWGIPTTCPMNNDHPLDRTFLATTVSWKASALCHKPLYFEEIDLERSGHELGPVIQPFISTAHFFGNVIFLPYHMGVHPNNECQYALGHYRPGNCAPWSIQPVPLSARGLAAQGAAIGAGVLILP